MPDQGAPPIAASAALSHALDAVVEQEARRGHGSDSATPPRPRFDARWLAAAVASWGVVAMLVFVEPSVARGPRHAPWEPAPQLAEASVRYGLWLARHQIESFRAAQNRLPISLAEAGVVDTSLRMVQLAQFDYAVAGQQGEVVVLLTSSMAADSFLGRSLERLRRP